MKLKINIGNIVYPPPLFAESGGSEFIPERVLGLPNTSAAELLSGLKFLVRQLDKWDVSGNILLSVS